MNVRQKFGPVSKGTPCIGCGKSKWCSVSADGSTFHCNRESAGCVATKKDKNGKPYFVFKVGDAIPSLPAPPIRPADAPERADPDTLHKVYSALLGKLSLTDGHRGALRQRGLSDAVIDRNQYRSLPGPGRSRIAMQLRERFGDDVLTVPGFFVKSNSRGDYLTLAGPVGLVVPVRDSEKRVVALKVRRENAKADEGKYVYVSSSNHGGPGSGAPVHVPLGTSTKAVIMRLTEGEIKADVAASLDNIPTISAPGVSTWRPALETLISLGCKTVRLAFDADADEKPNVARALSNCFDGLTAAGLAVELEQWDKTKGKGIDDLLAAKGQPDVLRGDDARSAVAAKLAALVPEADGGDGDRPANIGGYFIENNTTYRLKGVGDHEVALPLANFAARIVEECEHDDGTEKTLHLAVEGRLSSGAALARVTVSATEFAGMNWIVEKWGTRAVVYAGMGAKDHLRAALQILSGSAPRRTVYQHTGWRKIGDGSIYLHAGGAIGADGAVEVSVDLPDALAGLALPSLPDGDELRHAVRASLGFLDLGPDRLTVPLLAAVFRAALGDTDFSLHLSGPTGTYKSEAAALVQQHFGPALDARHLPGSWSSTGNALEMLAFTAKDALMVVDDFCPSGSSADVQRSHRDADRLFRGQGNRSGRHRLRSDATLRPAKPPRGLILSTGEDSPRGQSLKARVLTLEVGPSDFGPQPPHRNERLTKCQSDAGAGFYAMALAGFICWLAPNYETIRGRLRTERDKIRDQIRDANQHARTPAILADLAIGWKNLLEFAEAGGAISDSEMATLWKRGLDALAEAGARQAEHIAVSEPAAHFIRLLGSVISSGRGHVAAMDGTAPKGAESWGWRERIIGTGEHGRAEIQPQGKRVGWVNGDALYLDFDSAFAECQGLANDQGESIAVTVRTLKKRLHERGYLAAVGKNRGRESLSIRQTVEGKRREVVHLRSNALSMPCAPDQPDREPGIDPDRGPVAGQVIGQVKRDADSDLTDNLPKNAGNDRSVVRSGRSETWKGANGDGPYGAAAGRL